MFRNDKTGCWNMRLDGELGNLYFRKTRFNSTLNAAVHKISHKTLTVTCFHIIKPQSKEQIDLSQSIDRFFEVFGDL